MTPEIRFFTLKSKKEKVLCRRGQVGGDPRIMIVATWEQKLYHRNKKEAVNRTLVLQRKIRTHLDLLLSIPQLGGEKCQNVYR